jgi:hypothetical protein
VSKTLVKPILRVTLDEIFLLPYIDRSDHFGVPR